MFEHADIEILGMEDVPLSRDIYLMGQEWMAAYSDAMLKGISGGDWENVGYISYACAHGIDADGIDLSWYPNIFDRFHEVRVTLPRRHFITCIELYEYDEKPRVFVTDEWLENLHSCVFSAFALVDAIGVKRELTKGTITQEKLGDLREQIDKISSEYPDVLFTSFADSLILKTNWTVGQWDKEINYTYEPEKIIRILPDLAAAYMRTLGLPIYAVVTQGQNEFYGNELIHISSTGNHISLNSLGLPFAQLQAIEAAAKRAAKAGDHGLTELYLDNSFFRSLKLEYSFDKNMVPKFPYLAPMAAHPCHYVLGTFDMILSNLKT